MKTIPINAATAYECEKEANKTITNKASSGFKVIKITIIGEAKITLSFVSTKEHVMQKIEIICGPERAILQNTQKYLTNLKQEKKQAYTQESAKVGTDRWYNIILHDK